MVSPDRLWSPSCLRYGWLWYAEAAPPYTWHGSGDQYSYWYYGNEIAAGRGLVGYLTHVPTAYYPIGYPALLAALFFVVIHLHLPGDLMYWAGLMHVVMSTATVVLVFLIGRRLFNSTTGLIAAALFAVMPNAIYEVTSLQLETAFIFFSTAALTVIVLHDWSTGLPSRNRLLAFGFVLGLSVLIRPFSIWFVVVSSWPRWPFRPAGVERSRSRSCRYSWWSACRSRGSSATSSACTRSCSRRRTPATRSVSIATPRHRAASASRITTGVSTPVA